MNYAFGDMRELEEEMRRAFHDHFKEDINVSEEIGVMLASSFDDKEFEDLTVEQVANGPAEYSSWNGRNCFNSYIFWFFNCISLGRLVRNILWPCRWKNR